MERTQRLQLQQINNVHIATDRKQLDRIKNLYRMTLRHNLVQEQPTRDCLRKLISCLATKYEYLMQVTQGTATELHQTYKEIHEECNTLLKLSPPTPPISPISPSFVEF